MAGLDAATQRLQAALRRLDEAMQRRAAPAPSGSGEAEALAAVRGERDRLAAELEGLRAEVSRLQALTTTVSGRLDTAIGDLRDVLER